MELERGLALAQRPIFVCGLPRSGTTYLRDLLDGHPELVVVPAESQFYTALERSLFALRADRHSAYLGTEWLRQMINHPPYWLLGRSRTGRSPYVAFARNFAAWSAVGDRRSEARTGSWPLAALALAYAQHLGGGHIPPGARMWVEKSPTSERFLDRIWRDFPAAKILHVVRDPEAVLVSYKAAKQHDWSRSRAAAMTLRQMVPSYRIAAGTRPDGRYCLVHYEELAADPGKAMRRVVEFLGIEPLPVPLQPTIAGMPAVNNSSFTEGRPRSDSAVNRFERLLLELGVGRWARQLGY
jgi:hypothetical protein